VIARLLFFLPTNPHITLENFNHIARGKGEDAEGMTRPEVEAILGPPGDYRTRPTRPGLTLFMGMGSAAPPGPGKPEALWWLGDDLEIAIRFDLEGQVCETGIIYREPVSVGLLELLRWHCWNRWRESRR